MGRPAQLRTVHGMSWGEVTRIGRWDRCVSVYEQYLYDTDSATQHHIRETGVGISHLQAARVATKYGDSPRARRSVGDATGLVACYAWRGRGARMECINVVLRRDVKAILVHVII